MKTQLTSIFLISLIVTQPIYAASASVPQFGPMRTYQHLPRAIGNDSIGGDDQRNDPLGRLRSRLRLAELWLNGRLSQVLPMIGIPLLGDFLEDGNGEEFDDIGATPNPEEDPDEEPDEDDPEDKPEAKVKPKEDLPVVEEDSNASGGWYIPREPRPLQEDPEYCGNGRSGLGKPNILPKSIHDLLHPKPGDNIDPRWSVPGGPQSISELFGQDNATPEPLVEPMIDRWEATSIKPPRLDGQSDLTSLKWKKPKWVQDAQNGAEGLKNDLEEKAGELNEAITEGAEVIEGAVTDGVKAAEEGVNNAGQTLEKAGGDAAAEGKRLAKTVEQEAGRMADDLEHLPENLHKTLREKGMAASRYFNSRVKELDPANENSLIRQYLRHVGVRPEDMSEQDWYLAGIVIIVIALMIATGTPPSGAEDILYSFGIVYAGKNGEFGIYSSPDDDDEDGPIKISVNKERARAPEWKNPSADYDAEMARVEALLDLIARHNIPDLPDHVLESLLPKALKNQPLTTDESNGLLVHIEDWERQLEQQNASSTDLETISVLADGVAKSVFEVGSSQLQQANSEGAQSLVDYSDRLDDFLDRRGKDVGDLPEILDLGTDFAEISQESGDQQAQSISYEIFQAVNGLVGLDGKTIGNAATQAQAYSIFDLTPLRTALELYSGRYVDTQSTMDQWNHGNFEIVYGEEKPFTEQVVDTAIELAPLAVGGVLAYGGGKIATKYLKGGRTLQDVERVSEVVESAKKFEVPKNKIGDYMGSIREATNTRGNFGMGTGKRSEAEFLGESWVGPNPIKKDYPGKPGKYIYQSQDGTKQYREPVFKPELGKTQANYDWRPGNSGRFEGNGHFDVIE